MQLRDYQIDMIDRARESLRVNQRVLLQAPTGAGKTALTVFMMQQAALRGRRSCFIVHQNELLTQTSQALWKQKLEHGMIASGKGRSGMPAQVASVQTLVNRLSHYPEWDLIIIDEAHRAAANTYKKVVAAYPRAKVLGLSATPQRTDGRGLDDMFDDLVVGPSIRSLIDAIWLCDYELYAPNIAIDVSEVKTTAGDYDQGDLERAIDKPTITGDAVQHYRSLAMGKRCVVMCVTINHAQHVAEQYRAAGIPAASLDGTMTNKERAELIEEFRAGRLLVLTSVQLLLEGLDVPDIEVVQWLRPTKSLIVFMQGNGRGFRPSDGKQHLIILDHVGNVMRHGMPDRDRVWTLQGRKKGTRRATETEDDFGIQTCPKCRHVFLSGVKECPKCGAVVELKERKIEQVDGVLQKIERDAQIREQKIEQGMSRTLQDLVLLGHRRGMSNPTGWAVNVHCAREGRRATPDDYRKARAALLAIREAA